MIIRLFIVIAIQFYKKSSVNWNVSWEPAWSISSSYSVQAARQHYFKDGILFHSRSGEIFQLIVSTQHDNVPHIDVIYTGEIEYKALLERSNDRFEILILLTADPSVVSVGGDKVVVYNCEMSNDFKEHAMCVIDLSKPYRMLHHYRADQPLSVLCVSSLSKELHQIEIQVSFYL